MIMSGVEDGTILHFDSETDGTVINDQWKLTIGRREDNDMPLQNDTFISRHHATLHWRQEQWWIEDRNSTNGTFVEQEDNYANDERIFGFRHIPEGQLFRVGRTWLRIQANR